MTAARVAGSYRDRKGYARLSAGGRLVRTEIARDDRPALGIDGAALLLEHERIPFISHPYEWPFAALRAAALLQLDLHLELLQHGFTLSDASAYNIQFRGPEPVFIHVLSVERYQEGSYWSGHRQFCDQFLSPLLLTAKFGIPYHASYRGRLEGFSSTELAALLRLRDRLSLRMLLNVVLPARFEAAARRGRVDAAGVVPRRGLPKEPPPLPPGQQGGPRPCRSEASLPYCQDDRAGRRGRPERSF